MIFQWPQITELCLMMFGLAYSLTNHGKPRTGKTSFLASLIAISFAAFIMYKGGFWTGGIAP
jgi:hypothetical protein